MENESHHFFFLPILVVLSVVFLFLISGILDTLIEACDRQDCGPITRTLLSFFVIILQIVALPITLSIIVLTIVAFCLITVLQALGWAFLILVSNPVGIALLAIVTFGYFNTSQ
ncbi:uncharacterized protein LOC101863497 [Aplysia californica]|uniref:Uncharacterized protein LOC101863497 n=1 Tax=Aplysia californica TaxID=6500 RepID=A0ABM0JIH7_APLCA|nr:uncharacterized protein LOC101863497 [Aplysia californica]